MIGKEVLMSKKSFVLYTEWEDAFDQQPNDVAGELIKLIFDYVRTGEVLISDNPVVNAMFSIFRPAIDRNIDKYDEVVEKRREAGRMGGLKKSQNKQNLANVASASKCKQNLANVADSVSDSVSDINKEKIVKEKSLSLSDRTEKFKEELIPFVQKYGKDMIFAFFDYWSEPNPSKTKMKFEMQKTWDIAKRLRTWERRLNEKR